jgi:hypothetical protein
MTKKRKAAGRHSSTKSIIVGILIFICWGSLASRQAGAQVRGQYTPGLNATNSGTLPEPGFTYVNVFQNYSFNKLKGPNGNRIPVDGTFSVFDDQNIFIWVSPKKILGGAHFAALADLPIANSSLTSATLGAIGGGGGFADSYYQPFTLGWKFNRADIQAAYGFFAPTGRFNPGATNNIGSGYWGHFLTSGQTVFLTRNKGTAASAYEVYEFHTTQKGTDIHPGQTLDLDYSLTQLIPLQKDMKTLLQVGLIGYGQWQTTSRSGPNIDPVDASQRKYRVNSLGVGANVILPARKAAVGFKWFGELGNSSTVQGHSLQISGNITF